MEEATPYRMRIFEAPNSQGLRAAAFLADGPDEERQAWMQSLPLGDYEISIRPVVEPPIVI